MSASKPSTGFRRDIQGLRAVAVLTVVLDHVFGWPHGGFLGVDIFFVISGFLITGLMLREHRETGHISFTGFYRRRIKRILPAASFVLVVTAVASQLILVPVLARQALTDALWSFFFAANWHFAAVGTDYFQQELPPSPVQHYWSLSVEEQFYFVWPMMLLLLLAVSRRRLVLVALVTAAIVAASLVWAVHSTQQEPTSAYFSTFARAWQLLAGALLALAATPLGRLPARARPVMAWAGLALLVGSVLLVTPERGIPAPLSVPVVIGTLLVLAAGIEAPSLRYAAPLTNALASYFGKISFSLYLWHWPVVVLLANLMDDQTVSYYMLALTISVALSAVSFHLVEDPARRSNWLSEKPRRREGTRSRRPSAFSASESRRLQTGWVGVLAVVVIVSCAFGFASYNSPPPSAPSSTSTLLVSEDEEEVSTEDEPLGETKLERAIQTQLVEALAMTDFPALRPGVDDLSALPADRVDYLEQPCVPSAPPGCTPGDGSAGTIWVMGDSMARMWASTIEKTLAPRGYEVVRQWLVGCPVIALEFDRVDRLDCNEHKADVLDRVETERPDMVFISDLYFQIGDGLYSGATGLEAQAQWQSAVEQTLDVVTPFVDQVILLSAPPEAADPLKCITRFSDPGDCVTTISDEWVLARDAEERAALGRSKVTFIDTSPWACSLADGRCPAFVAGMVMRGDRFHMTQAYAEYVAPLLEERLKMSDVL